MDPKIFRMNTNLILRLYKRLKNALKSRYLVWDILKFAISPEILLSKKNIPNELCFKVIDEIYGYNKIMDAWDVLLESQNAEGILYYAKKFYKYCNSDDILWNCDPEVYNLFLNRFETKEKDYHLRSAIRGKNVKLFEYLCKEAPKHESKSDICCDIVYKTIYFGLDLSKIIENHGINSSILQSICYIGGGLAELEDNVAELIVKEDFVEKYEDFICGFVFRYHNAFKVFIKIFHSLNYPQFEDLVTAGNVESVKYYYNLFPEEFDHDFGCLKIENHLNLIFLIETGLYEPSLETMMFNAENDLDKNCEVLSEYVMISYSDLYDYIDNIDEKSDVLDFCYKKHKQMKNSFENF